MCVYAGYTCAYISSLICVSVFDFVYVCVAIKPGTDSLLPRSDIALVYLPRCVFVIRALTHHNSFLPRLHTDVG